MTIHIEIAKSYKKGHWNIRTGDIEGCSEVSLLSEKELITELKEQLKIELSLKGD